LVNIRTRIAELFYCNPGYRTASLNNNPSATAGTKLAQGNVVFPAYLQRQCIYIYPLARKSQVLSYQIIQSGYDLLDKFTVS